MGYGIKHTTSNISNTLRKGNIATTSAHSADPSQNFHSGIPLENGKHTVVQVHSSNDPDFWSLDDYDFVRLINSLGGNVYTPLEAKNYIKTQNDIFYIDDIIYNSSVMENLLVSLNGSYDSSFTNNEPTTNLITANGLDFTQMGSYGNLSRTQVTDENSSTGYACEMEILDGGAINPAARIAFGDSYTIPSSGNAFISVYVKFEGGASSNIQPMVYNGTGTAWQFLLPLDGGSVYLTDEYRRFGLYTALTANPGFSMAKGNSNNQTGQKTRWHSPQVEDNVTGTNFVSGSRIQNTTWIDLGQSGSNATLEIDSFDNGVFKTNIGGGTSKTSIPKPSGLATDQYMTIEVLFKLNTLPTTQYGTNTPILGARVGSDYMIFAYPQVDNKSHLGVSYDDSRFQASHESVFETEAGRWVRFTHVGIPYVEGGYQRGKLMYYINGVLDRDEFISGDSNGWSVPNPFYLAHDARWGVYSDLEFAEVKIYNKQLSAKEISQNFHGGNIVTDELVLAVDAGNLVSYESGSSTTYDMVKGDEGDGYSSYDLSGTLTNGVLFNKMNGGTWDFDGTDDHISFGYQSFQYQYDDPFSLEVWVNPDAVSGFKHLIGVTFGSYRLAHSGAGLSFRLDSNNLIASGGTLVVGEWSHIVATYNPSTFTAKIYQNGIEVASATDTSANWTTQGTDFRIASSPGEDYYFNGKIAIGRVYNKVLTPDEAQQNYIAHKARFSS
jgi:hypothetical protein